MAIVKPVRDNIITFVYTPEKEDEISCAWARFKLDLDRYSMSIESDCGNYCYTGWTPTPDRESFLHLCQRFYKGYLLEKLSKENVVNGKATWEALKENLADEIKEYNLEEDWEDWSPQIEQACYEYSDVDNTYRSIESAMDFGEFKIKIPDLWEIINCSIVSDYPAGAKTIIDIYFKYIVPAIKEYAAKKDFKIGDKVLVVSNNSIFYNSVGIVNGFVNDKIKVAVNEGVCCSYTYLKPESLEIQIKEEK